jgi:cytidine deaminase
LNDSKKRALGSTDRRRRTADRRSGGERRGGGERRSLKQPVARDRRTRERRRAADRRSGRDRRDETGWQTIGLEGAAIVQMGPEDELISAAASARLRAHARYSGFLVGAALETADGQIITGCNIENATYGLTLCAERVALVKALSEGHALFTRVVLIADTTSPTPPCGTCRQMLWEYCGDIGVVICNLDGALGRYRLSALLPLPFDSRLLE